MNKIQQLLEMQLQFFAEPDDKGEGGNSDEGNPNPEGGKGEPADAGNPDSDKGKGDGGDSDLPSTQSELDALINKTNQKAIENTKKDLYTKDDVDQAIQTAIEKNKEYSNLSEDERKQRELEDERTEFEKEKAKFKQERLVSDIKADLAERKLPTKIDEYDFAELFAKENDAEKALDGVKAFENAFKEAVAEEIKDSYKQGTPGTGSNGGSNGQSLGERLAKNKKKQQGKIFDK